MASEAEALSQAVSRLQSAMQSTQPAQLPAAASQVRFELKNIGIICYICSSKKVPDFHRCVLRFGSPVDLAMSSCLTAAPVAPDMTCVL